MNRGFHREHHLYPSVPFYELKALSNILIKAKILNHPKPSFLSSFPKEWK
jgi:fatty acid desaturase